MEGVNKFFVILGVFSGVREICNFVWGKIMCFVSRYLMFRLFVDM